MYYVPSADHAHTTVAYITKEVTGGSFLAKYSCLRIERDHHCAAAAHHPNFLYGSYKGRRELVWIAGCVLLDVNAGHGVYRVLVAVGPEGIFCHHGGHQHPERNSVDGKWDQGAASWRHRDGHAHRLPFFYAARVPDSGIHFCVCRDACLFVSQSWRRRSGDGRSDRSQTCRPNLSIPSNW